MEEKNNQHTTSHYSCNITKIVKNLRVQLNYKYYHKLKRRLKTFKISFLLNTQNHVSRVSKNKAHIFIAKMMLNLPTISWNSGLIQICCTVTPRTDLIRIWWQWHWFIETYTLLPERSIILRRDQAFECWHEENEVKRYRI